LHFGK